VVSISTIPRGYSCVSTAGNLDAQGGPIPANIEDLFPVWNDVSTWNLAPLSPIARRYSRSVGNCKVYPSRHQYATWIQDDWRITPSLTLNLGLRYDLATGVFAEYVSLPPFLTSDRSLDDNNIAPRLGFAFNVTRRTVLRGGFGKYFAEVSTPQQTLLWTQLAQPEVLYDGRSDFASNPFNGPPPTFEEVTQSGLRRSLTNLVSPDSQVPYSYQTSIGVQHQFGDTVAVEADYVYTGTRHDVFSRNINLTYDRATGLNYPFTDIDNFSRRILAWQVAETFAPANSVAVLVEAGRGATPSETTPVVLADGGVENVNAQVDELITTGVCAGSWRSRN
jgi:TonB dependent receptor-like, beta-barrel